MFEGSTVILCFQQRGPQIREGAQDPGNHCLRVLDARLRKPLRFAPGLAHDPVMSFDEGISDGRFPFHDAHREDRHPPIPRDIAQTIGKIAFPLPAQPRDPVRRNIGQYNR